MTTASFEGVELLITKWKDQEDGVLVLNCLEYLDTVSLIQKKSVNKQWQQLCTKAIDDKCDGGQKKGFQSKQELKEAVNKYSPGFHRHNTHCPPTHAEEIATTYGYPINKWDVSNIKDFSSLFRGKVEFNEPIGSWDVSNATIMNCMFYQAWSFNQDISSWDVSSVTTYMRHMFAYCHSFNQDLSLWDVSSVTDMAGMFCYCHSFNQDLSSWDVSNVTTMYSMFLYATSFNQDLSSWDVSNVNEFYRMFDNCLFDARRLPWFRRYMVTNVR